MSVLPLLTASVVKMEGEDVVVLVAGDPKDITVLAADFPPKILLPPTKEKSDWLAR